ncbi:tetratricopeptide repeat protein [Phenylobacterium sp. VNQ135]|uniref:O-linked N-acetylglucosamine transferase, SPINDLY family protein n=1 Tax=Phenylobacterium sp. VNQ135 TaxID=3400922 RepID=UPI003C0268FD
MRERLAAAQAALQGGRLAEAVELLAAVLTEAPEQNARVYQTLALQLYRVGRHAEAEAWVRQGLDHHPRNFELWNMRGVLLRRLGRLDEAFEALNAALRLQPSSTSVLTNLANVQLDRDDDAAAESILTRLVRMEPKNGEHQRLLARALRRQGRHEPALARLRQSVLLDRKNINAWLDLAGLLLDMRRDDEAADAVERASTIFPDHEKFREGRISLIRRKEGQAAAIAALEAVLAKDPNQAWAHRQLGQMLADTDRPRANDHLRQAAALSPGDVDVRFSLAESLQRSRYGDEAAHIEDSYQVIRDVPALRTLTIRNRKIAAEIFQRIGDHERLEQLGSVRDLGRAYVGASMHAPLMALLSRVRTAEDRRELVEAHRAWGRQIESIAAQDPIVRPPRPADRKKLRIGFMSSDLRAHPVGWFTLPLLRHYDRERFEVYCYSYKQGEADPVQDGMAQLVDVFRWRPDISDRDAAQMIADDQLDMLIELGGSTHMNKIEVMAYKPAPLSASWLGYAHSVGLSAIDYLVLDPFMKPADPALLIEQPLMLPHCWYSLAPEIYGPEPALELQAPVERNGYVTFGTANNPYKYGPEMLASWARIMARTPNSRFLFIRPEGGAPSFRAHMTAAFAAEGVAPERILFEPVRGKHLPFYNQIDMSLDTWPQTGGTTTCESLWMGAPVITLVGEALYERLSYSVLTNLGLGEFCARTIQEYEDIAVRLAADAGRIGELRRIMRPRMQESPLGRTKQWAEDFFEAVAAEIARRSA